MHPPNAGAQSTTPLAEAQPTVFISNVPLPPKLELHGNLAQNWSKWRQVWTAYETVTNLISQPSPFRVAAFITCIGPEALDIHNGLAFENDLDKQNVDKIMDLWHSYCLGETNVIYERFNFNNRNQTPDESIDAYAAALRGMATTCNFGNVRDELIRDTIVYGISNIKVQQKLLQEPKLTLKRCIDIVRIQPCKHDRVGRWRKGKVLRHVGVHLYLVRREDGTVLRRNRQFLRTSKEAFDDIVEDLPDISPSTEEQGPAMVNHKGETETNGLSESEEKTDKSEVYHSTSTEPQDSYVYVYIYVYTLLSKYCFVAVIAISIFLLFIRKGKM